MHTVTMVYIQHDYYDVNETALYESPKDKAVEKCIFRTAITHKENREFKCVVVNCDGHYLHSRKKVMSVAL